MDVGKQQAAAALTCAQTVRMGLTQVAIYSRGQRKVYAFDRAFGGACSQAHVYEDTKSLIRSVLDGGRSLLRLVC